MSLRVANQLIKPIVGAADIAGNFGVPYIGGAAGLIQGIQDSCEKVAVHRVSLLATAPSMYRFLTYPC